MHYITPIIAVTMSPLIAADFQLDYNAHLNMAFGHASIEEATLSTHAHDPNDEFTVQGLELNLSARYGDHVAGFVSYNTFLDDSDKIDGELEEAFLKLIELPAGFELRAGQLLNRATSQNSQHLHSWNFVDANLITTRFLGEEGLISNSAEISYKLPIEHNALLSLAFGDALEHDGHHHGPEEGHDDHSEEEEEEAHDEHLEGEGALLTDNIFSARLKGLYNHTDFHQYIYGVSYLQGDNAYKQTGRIFGVDATYLWRENGLEAGGKHFRATLEPVYRDFDYVNEDGDLSGSADEWGIHSSVGWGFRENWELGLRFDYLEGVDEPIEELESRHRSTAALTRRLSYNDYLAGHVRLQYNHDWRDGFGHEDAIWLQFQIDFGTGGEIR
ncbi:MAG: hypothetical protein ABGY95_01090 [Rubritalea sp.]|uniref:hypothetical protein n=1 Tax=Rubritalea sp. TaxID=2109375 RepID=UPI003242E8D7